MTQDGILLDKAGEASNSPFALFSEWTSDLDEKAYGGLLPKVSARYGRA
jgi:hypothetical protein